MKCRHCGRDSGLAFLDLGFSPPSNAYLSRQALRSPEVYFPLRLFVCEDCWLVQTEDYTDAEQLFAKDYAYFSSTSTSWLKHAARYSGMIIDRLDLTEESFVVEVASNDGYLLRNFVELGIPCLGIEPTSSTAEAAERLGIPVLRQFFGSKLAAELAEQGKRADLICGNNVYAHVPDINDFTCGLRLVLKESGTVNLEFPHLLRLMEGNQFDTVYHEHFSYLSLTAVSRIFSRHGLRIYDVDELDTHGGSLRIYGCHEEASREESRTVRELLDRERQYGLLDIGTYKAIQHIANRVKNDFLFFLLSEKREGKSIAGYGAAAKGNTLLNYAGIKHDLIDFVSDAAVAKQGKFMPGSHIPIVAPTELGVRKPDWVIIFPWNIADEVLAQNREVLSWGGRFIVAVPELRIVS